MVWRNLEGRAVENMIDLPLMTDPELQAAMRILSILACSRLHLPTSICIACSYAAW